MYMPYVYKMTHKITRQFYIGMRSSNVEPAERDLGIHYFTSNKFVKSNFKQFNLEILARFKTWKEAFIFENSIISKNFKNPLILNKHFQKTPSSFSMVGFKRPDVGLFNTLTKSKPKELRTYRCINCGEVYNRTEFVHKPIKALPMCSYKCANGYHSQFRISSKGKSKRCAAAGWNKGKPNPQAAINGKAGAAKASKTCTGRKLAIRDDGTRYWIYPNKS